MKKLLTLMLLISGINMFGAADPNFWRNRHKNTPTISSSFDFIVVNETGEPLVLKRYGFFNVPDNWTSFPRPLDKSQELEINSEDRGANYGLKSSIEVLPGVVRSGKIDAKRGSIEEFVPFEYDADVKRYAIRKNNDGTYVIKAADQPELE